MLSVHEAGGATTTYGSWPALHPAVREEGLSFWGSDIRKNFKGDAVHKYPYAHCVALSAEEEQKLNEAIAKGHSWGPTDNCSSWASDTFKGVTGVDINADDWMALGSETPREVGNSILEANGGMNTNLPGITQ